MKHSEKIILFENEYQILFDIIYRFVCGRIPQKQDAEDIVSETFLAAFKQLGSFDQNKGSLTDWVIGVAKNKIKMFWRSRRINVCLDEKVVELLKTDDKEICSLDDRLKLSVIFEGLSEEAKAILSLRFIDGWSFEEIAKILKINSSAARKRISRLLNKIRCTSCYEINSK